MKDGRKFSAEPKGRHVSCRSWSGAPSREVATSAGGWLRPDLAFFKGIPEKLDQCDHPREKAFGTVSSWGSRSAHTCARMGGFGVYVGQPETPGLVSEYLWCHAGPVISGDSCHRSPPATRTRCRQNWSRLQLEPGSRSSAACSVKTVHFSFQLSPFNWKLQKIHLF